MSPTALDPSAREAHGRRQAGIVFPAARASLSPVYLPDKLMAVVSSRVHDERVLVVPRAEASICLCPDYWRINLSASDNEAVLDVEDITVGVKTHSGKFRIHLVGTRADLQAVGPILDDLAGMADTPGDFLERALPELALRNVTVADVLDIGSRAPDLSIVERVRMIMHKGPRASEDCYIHLLATFQVAEAPDIEALLQKPDDLTLVAEYARSVLADLDEKSADATARMREAMGPATAYLILGPDGG